MSQRTAPEQWREGLTPSRRSRPTEDRRVRPNRPAAAPRPGTLPLDEVGLVEGSQNGAQVFTEQREQRPIGDVARGDDQKPCRDRPALVDSSSRPERGQRSPRSAASVNDHRFRTQLDEIGFDERIEPPHRGSPRTAPTMPRS
ncbi:hypothetical protein I4I73_05875 [Pseudonocardia sp. KRD-184]|uniref:Uncharacterized protein n=1 Tax=Pseudonocardia oceani TaxID=2792013 RepID=A0ABS6U930_9PSEU|nr:hypothetical protein [Pseudonocardia oceani]MBW0088655.1 hypothetical protein [Pseudonocardia oceani]MBW0095525.1 hypothetical protein [Pseudonocardia oceani]MBW0108494.1 hypothetical protein [Pseudonocardia oceani]MBW0121536.1 hypothetical protein [Pseudonocardia oceani]MBW0128717.1 hypothetical protein [Pseudonocardia oceani]